jgi:hypothetical protein
LRVGSSGRDGGIGLQPKSPPVNTATDRRTCRKEAVPRALARAFKSVTGRPDDERRGRGSGDCESDKARAKQDKAGNGYSEETVGSEFFTHDTPPIVSPCAKRTTVPLHSQKDSHPGASFELVLML